MATEESKRFDDEAQGDGRGVPKRTATEHGRSISRAAIARTSQASKRSGAQVRTRVRSDGSPGSGLEDGPVGGPAARRALRSQGRRTMRRLLDAGMKAIDERGYHATRVQDVVDIAKTSHGTFYLYFSNKDDLVRALTMEAASEATSLGRAMSEAGSDIDFGNWDQLRQWVAGYSAVWSRYAPLFRSWTDLIAIDEGIADQIRGMVRAHVDAIAARLSEAQPTGGTDPDVASLAILALLDRFHYLREFTGKPVDNSALDNLTTLIHHALFPAGSESAQPAV